MGINWREVINRGFPDIDKVRVGRKLIDQAIEGGLPLGTPRPEEVQSGSEIQKEIYQAVRTLLIPYEMFLHGQADDLQRAYHFNSLPSNVRHNDGRFTLVVYDRNRKPVELSLATKVEIKDGRFTYFCERVTNGKHTLIFNPPKLTEVTLEYTDPSNFPDLLQQSFRSPGYNGAGLRSLGFIATGPTNMAVVTNRGRGSSTWGVNSEGQIPTYPNMPFVKCMEVALQAAFPIVF